MIIKQALKVSSLLWVILLLPEAGISEDLSIPIEWYYGRWPSGHAAEAHRMIGEHQSPSGYTAYTYSNSSVRVGVNRFDDLLLTSDGSGEFRTADITLGFRPTRNWNISLDRFKFRSEYNRITESSPRLNLIDNGFHRLEASASIEWSNLSDVQISSNWQRYMEYVGRAVGKGQILTRTSGNVAIHSSKLNRLELANSSLSTYRDNAWEFEQFVEWGISDNWQLSLDIQNTVRKSFQYSAFESVENGERLIQTRRQKRDFYFPTYTLKSLHSLTENVVVEASFYQRFVGINTQFDFERTTLDSSITGQIGQSGPFSVDNGFGLSESIASVQVDVISEGSFVSTIVLDDYAGYYHQMLFAGQYHGQFAFEFRDPGQVRIDIRHSSHYGLTNNINIGSSVKYHWIDSRVIGPRLSSAFDLQWRSYDYRPNSGPGWYNDSPFDIQYGPIKRPGHLFFSVSVSPPSWQSPSGHGFLWLAGLRSDKNWQMSSTFIAGLVWQSEIRATSTILVLPDQTDRQNIDASLVKRLGGRFELSADYSNHARFNSDFQFTFNLRGFL